MGETKSIEIDLHYVADFNPARTKLLSRLRELADESDCEMAHLEADKLLLEYINDKEISQAFEKVKRWYA